MNRSFAIFFLAVILLLPLGAAKLFAKNKDKKNLDNLKKGTYMYDVFESDESIEEGKIIVK